MREELKRRGESIRGGICQGKGGGSPEKTQKQETAWKKKMGERWWWGGERQTETLKWLSKHIVSKNGDT